MPGRSGEVGAEQGFASENGYELISRSNSEAECYTSGMAVLGDPLALQRQCFNQNSRALHRIGFGIVLW